jgi:hypothetical protein
MQLGRLEWVGTTAWFFLAVNLFKVPFAVGLGRITWSPYGWTCVVVGAFLERWVLVLALCSGLRLLRLP